MGKKSFAGAQVLVKTFVVGTAMQEMQSHVELYLDLGTEGNCGTALPWFSKLAHSLLRAE